MLYTFPHELDYEVGRKIVQAVPGIDQVRFANSGSEATQAAIRLARAYTGKDKIMKWEGSYNGFLDCHAFSHVPALEAAGTERFPRTLPSQAGIPKAVEEHGHHRLLQRPRRVETLIKRNRDQLACVLGRADPRRRRHHPAGARLPRGPAPHLRRERRAARSSTRSSPASASRSAAPRSCTASSPTSPASPRRSAAARRARPPSAARRRSWSSRPTAWCCTAAPTAATR